MTNFTIGCDPELFVTKDGVPVTAHNLIPGDKKAPHKVEAGAIQVDGMAVEFNTNPVPYNDFAAFDKNITTVLTELAAAVKANGPGYKLVPSPTMQFDADYYATVPEEAKILGCEPDYCAYSEEPGVPNARPEGSSGLRSAAGHIHIGWGSDIPTDHPDHIQVCRSFIRNLDCFVGLAMTVIDTDAKRRELYGAAGAFRPKSYGVEYRTPSNEWLKGRRRRSFIHGLVVRAIEDMKSGTPMYDKLTKKGIDVRAIINSGDVEQAKDALKTFMSVTVPTFEEAMPGEAKAEAPAPAPVKKPRAKKATTLFTDEF